MHGESLLNSVDFCPIDPLRNVQIDRMDVNFHYEVLPLEEMADSVIYGRRVMRTGLTIIYPVLR